MRKPHTRDLISTTCYLCKFDCVSKEDMSKCVNFKKGHTADEYRNMINEQNVNLRKLCEKHDLKLNYMYKMLNNEIHMKFRYRVALDSILFEKEEYQEYIKKFEADGVVAYR